MQLVSQILVGALLVAGSATATPSGEATPRMGGSPDTVVIRLRPDAATVTQRIPALDGVVEAHAIRLEGQDLEVADAGEPGRPGSAPEIAQLPGAYHLRVGGDAPIALRYRVTGRLDRIPLFVPSPEAQLASGPVTLRVELTPESASALDLGTSLPRFQRSSDGALIADLSSTPTFVRLDQAGGLSFARAADLIVLILILLAAVWAWRTARRSA